MQARYKTTPECVLELPVPRHLVDEARARQTAADETKRCEAAGDETVEKAPVEVPHADDADQNSPKRSRLSDDLEAAPSPSVTLAACLEARSQASLYTRYLEPVEFSTERAHFATRSRVGVSRETRVSLRPRERAQ